MKTCSKCHVTKVLIDFHSSGYKKDKKSPWCKLCVYQCVKESKARRREAMGPAAWAEQLKNTRLKHTYGISLTDYKQMLIDQGRTCKICGSSNAGGSHNIFHVDHSHTTGKVRGLLCTSCNSAIGFLKDSPEILEKAINYLTVK